MVLSRKYHHHWPSSVVCVATGYHISVHSLFNLQGPCCFSWSLILPEAMWTFVVYAAIGGVAKVCISRCIQKPCGLLWSLLLPADIGKETFWQWYQWLQIYNWEWELPWQSFTTNFPHKHTHTHTVQKPLKIVTKMLKYSSSQIMASGQEAGGLCYCKKTGHW